jgi:serine/threonine protein kinase/tetratricopeptide (TPR) repeat protein
MSDHPTRVQIPHNNLTPDAAECEPQTVDGDPRHTLPAPEGAPGLSGVAPPPGYTLLAEIARGGMGVVYAARDATLDREVAVKVLIPGNATPAAAARFATEARVTAALAHPGVPPVHEFGTLPDGSPFLAMKLVRGTTLAARLKERADPSADLARFIQAFEQVCQAVAFAHSKGVIHRDLKPLNVMVGEFGEVQVMDWGLAKRVGSGLAQSPTEPNSPETIDWQSTAPPGLADGASPGDTPQMTAAGAVMGTLAYMPPEQASGDGARVGPRADVFALGAILCELLTGRPPYVGKSAQEVWRQARAGDLSAAHACLAGCGADEELVGLVRQCLSPEPKDRPRDAGELAARLEAYHAGVRQRLEQAQADRVAAEVRSREERKRRRVAVGLMASLLLMAVGAGAAGLWYQARQSVIRDRHTRLEADIDQTLRVAEETLDALHKDLDDPVDALTLPSEPLRWRGRLDALRTAIQRVKGLLEAVERPVDESLRTRFESLAAAADASERDRELAKRLDDIRFPATVFVGGKTQTVPVAPRYKVEFANAGLDIDGGEPEAVAARIRSARLRWYWVAALDHYAGTAEVESSLRARALEVARRADPHPWRDGFRDPAVWADRGRLEALARDPEAEKQPPAVVATLARVLEIRGGSAAPLLRTALGRHPRDYWLQIRLSNVSEDTTEAVACIRAALALRPDQAGAYNALGAKQEYMDREAEAIACYRRAIELDPAYLLAHYNLAKLLEKQGQTDEAIASLRRVVAIDPGNAHGQWKLGKLLQEKGELAEAIDCFRNAVAATPDEGYWHHLLGIALFENGQFASAAASLSRAVELYQVGRSNHSPAQNLLARSRRMLALEPRIPALLAGTARPANTTEALALAELCAVFREDYAAAARFYAQALEMKPDHPDHRAINHGFAAATAAARAAAGEGKGQKPSAAARAGLRRQALVFAEGILATYSKAETDTPAWRAYARSSLHTLEQGTEFRGLRDDVALAGLPLEERVAWKQLWANVSRVRLDTENRERTPFVVTGRDGKPERRYDTLAKALGEATAGDTVEIRADGPFDQPLLSVEKKPLTVRAGPGSKPVLRFRGADVVPGSAFWLVTGGGITLEGLDIRLLGDTVGDGYHPLLRVKGGAAHVAGCRFRYEGGKPHTLAIHGDGVEVVTLVGCEFDGPFTAPLGVYPASACRVRIDDCLFTGRCGAVVIETLSPTDRDVEVTFNRNTFTVPTAIDVRVRAHDPSPTPLAQPARGFRIAARGNVFGAETSAVAVNFLDSRKGTIPTGEEGGEHLRRVLRWEEAGNLYAEKVPPLRVSYGKTKELWAWYDQRQQTATVAADLAAWNRFWQLEDPRSRAEWVAYRGGAGQQLLQAFRETGPDAFLLHADLRKRLGVEDTDVPGIPAGLVGPGAAYERWKRTPDYLKWLVTSSQKK